METIDGGKRHIVKPKEMKKFRQLDTNIKSGRMIEKKDMKQKQQDMERQFVDNKYLTGKYKIMRANENAQAECRSCRFISSLLP